MDAESGDDNKHALTSKRDETRRDAIVMNLKSDSKDEVMHI